VHNRSDGDDGGPPSLPPHHPKPAPPRRAQGMLKSEHLIDVGPFSDARGHGYPHPHSHVTVSIQYSTLLLFNSIQNHLCDLRAFNLSRGSVGVAVARAAARAYVRRARRWPISSPWPSQPHLSLILSLPLVLTMAQITDTQSPTLAGLMKALGDGKDRFAVEDDVEGEQQTLMPVDTSNDLEGPSVPSHISTILATVGEVSMAVKEATDADYRR
jgi:hypothetical protein